MSDKIVKIIEDAINRRRFVERASRMAVAPATGIFFKSESALASATVPYLCCQLCKDPDLGCSYQNCTCEWSWLCCMPKTPCQIETKHIKCSECIQTPISPCDLPCANDPGCGTKAACPGVKCSKAQLVGGPACPGVPC